MAIRGKKTRNHGTMTEAAFWGMFKNAMRRLSMFWIPGEAYLKSIRKERSDLEMRKWDMSPGRSKYVYQCANCGQWFSRKEVEKDHKVACGTIKSFEDIGRVASRMFIEVNWGWQCLCKTCHKARTQAQRKKDK